MTSLELNKVSVAFGGLKALTNLDLSVPKGEIHGIIGPNGAGKTTLLNVICGVTRPDQGQIELNGRSIVGLNTSQIAQLGLGRTFQTSRMFKSMTVLENVMTGLHSKLNAEPWSAALASRATREEERHAAAEARKILDFVNLRRLENQEASGLSFGQQRLVEIARALIAKPIILLLDEPAVGLSATRVTELDALLRRIRDDHGVTIVMVEHVIQLVMGVCDRVTVLSSGTGIAEGTGPEVRANPRVQEAYLGKAMHA